MRSSSGGLCPSRGRGEGRNECEDSRTFRNTEYLKKCQGDGPHGEGKERCPVDSARPACPCDDSLENDETRDEDEPVRQVRAGYDGEHED